MHLDTMSYYYAAGTNQLDSTRRHGFLGGTLVRYWYDENGNLAIDSGRKAGFYYDLYNRLDTVLFPGGDDTSYIAFGYTPEGLRIYKDYHYWYLDECNGGGIEGRDLNGIKSGGDSLCVYYGQVATRYVREKPGGKVLAEYVNDPDHPLKFKFIYAGDQRIAMYDQSGNLHFYLNDHLGSARMVIDSTGTVKDTYKRYYAFGDAAQQTVSTGQRYRYTGKPFDDEGAFDLYYYGARYYDPKLGRFIAVDPYFAVAPAMSPYTYASNNPLSRIDASGLVSVKVELETVYGYPTGRTIYVADWKRREELDDFADCFLPFWGLIDVIEGEDEYTFVEGAGDAFEIIKRTPTFKTKVPKIFKNVLGRFFFALNIYDFLTMDVDSKDVMDEYKRLTAREGPCYSESCFRDRYRRAIENVKKDAKRSENQAADRETDDDNEYDHSHGNENTIPTGDDWFRNYDVSRNSP